MTEDDLDQPLLRNEEKEAHQAPQKEIEKTVNDADKFHQDWEIEKKRLLSKVRQI